MINKTRKKFGEKEPFKQGNCDSLLRSKQIVNWTISDFDVRIFLTGEVPPT